MSSIRSALVGALAFAALSSPASAAPMTVSAGAGGSFGPGDLFRQVTIRYDDGSGAETQRLRAGAFDLVSDVLGDFLAFCVDLDNALDLPAAYEMSTPSQITAAEAETVDKLFTSAYAEIDTPDEAAGFQLALWEAITDATLDLSAGAFQATGSGQPYALANSYLAGVAGAATGKFNLMYLATDASQDLITATPVPLPAAAWLLIGGVGALGALGGRRRG